MKYSENFEKDFKYYLNNRNKFTFSGDKILLKIVYSKTGVDGKYCYWKYDSTGKLLPTKHPNIVYRLLKTKASINFNIKQWVEGLKDYCFGYPNTDWFLNSKSIVWNKNGTFKESSIMEELKPLSWMIKAFENQSKKYYSQIK